MSEKLFSLIYLTKRPGGLDLLGHSLAVSPLCYELIVVDGFKGRAKRGEAVNYILNLRIPLKSYIDSSVDCSLGKSMNLGAACASTRNLVFLQDYCWCPPGWFYNLNYSFSYYQANTVVTGPASVRNTISPDRKGDVSLWNYDSESCWKKVKDEIRFHIPEKWELFNCIIPLHLFEKSNGLPHDIPVKELGFSVLAKANMLGYQKAYEPKLRVGRIEPKFFDVELVTVNQDFDFNLTRNNLSK